MDIPTLPLTRKRILVVEAESRAADTIVKSLEIEGYNVLRVADAPAALRFMQQLRPDLILADSHTASVNGTNLYASIRGHPQWTTIPFILLADRHHLNEIQQAKEQGVEDYLLKPVDAGSLARIVHARLLRSAELQIALIDQAYLETIEVLANTVEMRDPYTHGHIGRVSMYARWLAEAMSWPEDQLRMLAFGSRLHDIGKVIVPDQILKKPGDLTLEEWDMMKQHPVAGAKIVGSIKHLKDATNYVLYHHERWDGSGYPYGLQGREIPVEGRLLAIADVYDALTTDRPYHPAQPRPEVTRYLEQYAGVLFDPDMVPFFVQALEEKTRL
jgi:putative two-component system response regulator